jgi:hypothetical protein
MRSFASDDKPMNEKNQKHQIPKANSPELLSRLVDTVARGIRTSRGLAESLGVELATVQIYIQAGEWLGFVEHQGDAWLTPVGLEYAFAGRLRPTVYARAVWANPLVQELMQGRGTLLPGSDEIAVHVGRICPELGQEEIRRRATAVHNLLAPAMNRIRPKAVQTAGQMELPLAVSAPAQLSAPFAAENTDPFDPAVYQYFLTHLLDYGELSLAHIRGLLDAARADHLPLGGVLNMARERGDAIQIDDRLCATIGSIQRREVTSSTESIILSDAGYRIFLSSLLQETPRSRKEEIDLQTTEPRYIKWHHQLFGERKTPQQLKDRLKQLLIDRSLDGFPVAGDPGPPLVAEQMPFLDLWEKRGLMLCHPPSLNLLNGGLETINRLFKRLQFGTNVVGIPDLTDRSLHYHGGLLHPGEPPPRLVPDLLTLRLRVLMNCPYLCLTTALLLAQRLNPQGPGLFLESGRWVVRQNRRRLGKLFLVLDAFVLSREWHGCRRNTGDTQADAALAILENLGISTKLPNGTVLAERFFARLRSDAEQMEVYRLLRPLAEVLGAWAEKTEPIDTSGGRYAR